MEEKALANRPVGWYYTNMNISKSQEELLLAFIDMASVEGINAVSLSDIAKKVGKSKSTIFSHFTNKEEIVDNLYTYGVSLTSKEGLKISLKGSAMQVIRKSVDYWHRIYSEEPRRSFHRIVEMEKYRDSRALTISKSLDAMVYSQTLVILSELSDTRRLDIDELDLASESFAATILSYLGQSLIGDDEDLDWKEDRFINRFCNHYAVKKENILFDA